MEHCQYRPPRIREDRNRKTANPEGKSYYSEINGKFHILVSLFLYRFFVSSDSDMPDHDLEPPRFAQLALERVLQDWNALKSMIMFGSQENKDPCVFTNSCQCKV